MRSNSPSLNVSEASESRALAVGGVVGFQGLNGVGFRAYGLSSSGPGAVRRRGFLEVYTQHYGLGVTGLLLRNLN